MSKRDQYLNFKNLFTLFMESYNKSESVDVAEILKLTGWQKTTFDTYYNKKFKGKILKKSEFKNNFDVINITQYDEGSFLRLMSQNQSKSEKPFKKDLRAEVESLLSKAVESVYLAVDIYNRPQTQFRSNGYIVMMIIGWTSIMHAIFENENVDYFYKKADGTDEMIDGDKKTWELAECIKHTSLITAATKANLEIMIDLRNKIEHRFLPELDIHICGECQAALLNFEELVVEYFGVGYSLSSNLAIPLQLIKFNSKEREEALKKFHNNNFKDIMEYICKFRDALSDEVYNDLHYSFKVVLVPKIRNNPRRDDLAIEFLHQSEIEELDYDELMRSIALVKEKLVPVANLGKFKPLAVVKAVEEKIGKTFNIQHHTNAWRYFSVRKSGYQADGCDVKYCQFDAVHNDYIYTSEWVVFLIEKMSDIEIYNEVINYKTHGKS